MTNAPKAGDSGSASAPALIPSPLRPGDKVRFVSPGSSPDREAVLRRAEILRGWGFDVDFGEHAFTKVTYMAGTDEQRLADINAALRDPEVRAIFATRGGKGSYRIADALDFAAARDDPKFLVGFSDVTVLHLTLWKHCRLVGIHGTVSDRSDAVEGNRTLHDILSTRKDVVVRSRAEESTVALTTSGIAQGRLVGGNLDLITTSAGWALPDLNAAILLIEAVDRHVGHVDRQLTMLRKAGHLDGVAGVAVGQFTGFLPSGGGFTVVDLLRQHLAPLGVPILGGLPLGHGHAPLSVPVGAPATIDTSSRTLTVELDAPGG